MPPLALRMFFFLLGSASTGCLLFELSEALRARAVMNGEDTAHITTGILLIGHLQARTSSQLQLSVIPHGVIVKTIC